MAFNVGDRVKHRFEGLATVAGFKNESCVLLHFDNLFTEERQVFEYGWSLHNCELVEEAVTIEEDWS